MATLNKQTTQSKTKRPLFGLSFSFHDEQNYFIENLALLLASGMDIIVALKAIESEIRSTTLRYVINNLMEDISSGCSLSDALDKTSLLPKHIISLIRIGEKSGRLHESLGVIVVQQEKTRLFKSKIRSAMMYPLFVLLLALIVGIGIAWFILPRLASVFSQLNLTLPLVTRLLMSLGGFLAKYGSIAVPSFLAGLSLLFYFIFGFSKTKFIGQHILLIIPGVKRLLKEVELSRFGYIMGTLLHGGLPIVDALDSLSESTPLFSYQKLYCQLKEDIEEGKSFQESFELHHRFRKYIPSSIQSLIVIGEQSGRLTKIFSDIGNTFENKTEITTKNLSVILEPIMLVIVWLGVVAVALAVILPIYSLVGGLNKPQSAKPRPAPISNPAQSKNQTTNKTPVIIPTSTKASPTTKTVKILSTGLGYLNVRSEPNAKSALVKKINQGETYEYSERSSGWIKIFLSPTTSGWVSDKYVLVNK